LAALCFAGFTTVGVEGRKLGVCFAYAIMVLFRLHRAMDGIARGSWRDHRDDLASSNRSTFYCGVGISAF
jgi:hypothetical protein